MKFWATHQQTWLHPRTPSLHLIRAGFASYLMNCAQREELLSPITHDEPCKTLPPCRTRPHPSLAGDSKRTRCRAEVAECPRILPHSSLLLPSLPFLCHLTHGQMGNILKTNSSKIFQKCILSVYFTSQLPTSSHLRPSWVIFPSNGRSCRANRHTLKRTQWLGSPTPAKKKANPRSSDVTGELQVPKWRSHAHVHTLILAYFLSRLHA